MLVTEFAKNKLTIRGLPTELLMAVEALKEYLGEKYTEEFKEILRDKEIDHIEFNCDKKLSDEIQLVLFRFPLTLTF